MVPRIVVVLELGTNLLCQVDGHIALQQIMYDEVRMLIVGCNLDRKKTCLLVHLGGKVGRMVEQTQNSPIVGVVLEGEEQGCLAFPVDDCASIGVLHQNSIDHGGLALVLEGNG
jgi:hypothetical protein